MARFELKLPKMGESIVEATITSWLKEVGEVVEIDDAVVEVATDKVDSEVPSEVEGTLVEILFSKDDVVKVGETLAIIETDADLPQQTIVTSAPKEEVIMETTAVVEESVATIENELQTIQEKTTVGFSEITSFEGRFYSPLVRNIAQTEGISPEELDSIPGTGKEGRVTKSDILAYLSNRSGNPLKQQEHKTNTEVSTPLYKRTEAQKNLKSKEPEIQQSPIELQEGDEIVALSRMGKLIAKHMVDSVRTSVHVQSFIEIDVTNIVNWRNKVKDDFFEREEEKLTFTPIFMQAVAQTLKQFPLINISFDGEKVIKRKNINLGMAAALPDGNLIVPVIKNADRLSLVGLTKKVNDLARRARANSLKPDEIKDGTYTVTNVGGFGSLTGTPIINQPQVAILALGAIIKKPAVIESAEGDVIAIRHKMIVSHSYDHRVINGAKGGMFIKTFKEILEAWDVDKTF